ncbi:MAG: hypothetical protein ABSB42_01325 [Tepidisphaeraceae bacterium]|jgi:hypothetical protein
MKRFRQWVLKGLGGTSLLLCVATLAIWLTTYGKKSPAEQHFIVSDYRFTARSYLGVLSISWQQGHPARKGGWQSPSGTMWDVRYSGFRNDELFLRFGFKLAPSGATIGYAPGYRLAKQGVALIPYWSLSFAFGLASIACFWFSRQPNHLLAGQCARCGYDLRATPDRCPECGTIPKKAI